MIGKLYGIGVGPGEAELLTLKALRIMRESDVIIVPGTDVEKVWHIRLCSLYSRRSQKKQGLR